MRVDGDAADVVKAESQAAPAEENAAAPSAAAPAPAVAAAPALSPAASRRAKTMGHCLPCDPSALGDDDAPQGGTPAPPGTKNDVHVRWAHVVCAQCVPGVEIAATPEPGPASAVVKGLDRVPRECFEGECAACRRSEGAVVSCGYYGCGLRFHALCARRNGWLLTECVRQDERRLAYCARHSVSERRRMDGGFGGGRGRGRGPGRPPIHGGRGGRGGRSKAAGLAARRRPAPTRDEMELLKRTRFGLEKLRLLCERVLRREKFKRQAMDLNAELWTMQMAGMDDGKAAATSPPPSPSRRTTLLTPTLAAAANEQLARAGYEYTPAT